MKVALIIPAAGASRRYNEAGGLRSKLEEDLGGRPVLQRTIELFVKHETVGPLIETIIVAGPSDDGEYSEFKERHGDKLGLLGAKVCKGGVTHRWETVRNALAMVPAECTHIAVHDAARPCTPPELIDRIFDMAQRHKAVIPVVEVSDTLKKIEATDEPEMADDPVAAILGTSAKDGARLRVVSKTIDRAGVSMVQTPQVFEAELLRRAYAQKDLTSTDDAGLVERLGERVVVVTGDVRNFKITRPEDLTLARAVLGVRAPEGRAAHKRF